MISWRSSLVQCEVCMTRLEYSAYIGRRAHVLEISCRLFASAGLPHILVMLAAICRPLSSALQTQIREKFARYKKKALNIQCI
jgi:hypothetical protein